MVEILDRAVDALHHAIGRRRGRLCQPVFYAVFGAGFVEPMVAAGFLVAPCKPIRKLKAIVSQDMGDVEREKRQTTGHKPPCWRLLEIVAACWLAVNQNSV